VRKKVFWNYVLCGNILERAGFVNEEQFLPQFSGNIFLCGEKDLAINKACYQGIYWPDNGPFFAFRWFL
jgi:hypothetical protein